MLVKREKKREAYFRASFVKVLLILRAFIIELKMQHLFAFSAISNAYFPRELYIPDEYFQLFCFQCEQ